MGIHDDSVGQGDILYFGCFKSNCNAATLQRNINNAKVLLVTSIDIAECRSDIVERIADNRHRADGNLQSCHYLIVLEAIESWRDIEVVASCRNPELSMRIGKQTMQIDIHLNFLDDLKCSKVNDHDAIVVKWYAIPATVRHIEFSIDDGHFFGLIPDNHRIDLLQGQCIDLIHTSQGTILGNLHGSCITAHIGESSIESQVAAVVDIDLPEASRRTCFTHFHLVRAIHHYPKFRTINADVIAHIAEFLDGRRIALGIDVPIIVNGRIRATEVEVIQGAAIGAHIPFVEDVKAVEMCFLDRRDTRVFVSHIRDIFILAAREQTQRQEPKQ